ncbi:phosphotransferase [Bacillus paramycoides]|uniref:phosphotransferase n=1 Tax=Bacillus paramycoides TaxID=2026194 RepID=UPI003D07E03F
MDVYIRKQLYAQYDLDGFATASLLHGGENQTYIIESNKNKFVVRQYREGRYTHKQIVAEIHWLIELQKQMLVPEIVVNKNGDCITSVTGDEGSIHIAIKLSLCKVNFRRDYFFFLKGKCRWLKDLHTK